MTPAPAAPTIGVATQPMEDSLTSEELEGRLAALEFVAALTIRDSGRNFHADWHARWPEALDTLLAKIDEGSVASPETPAAKQAMKDALSGIFKLRAYPPAGRPY